MVVVKGEEFENEEIHITQDSQFEREEARKCADPDKKSNGTHGPE